MAVYKGNIKQKELYIGSTKIGKIYKGNQLLYKRLGKIPVYAFTYQNRGYTYPIYLIGSYDTNGYVADDYEFIKSISGNIGQANSTVTAALVYSEDFYFTYNYRSLLTVQDITLYVYQRKTPGDSFFPDVTTNLYVLSNNKVGDTILSSPGKTALDSNYLYRNPIEITPDYMKYIDSSTTVKATRNPSGDLYLTNEGLIPVNNN